LGANSIPRRIVKRLIGRVLDEDRYSYVQCAAKSLDIVTGSWREPELDLLPYAVRPGDTVLDVGANFGLYSHHLSKAVGPKGKVFAFEPVPFTYKTLRRVARVLRLGNVEIVPKGCSNEAGTVTFQVPLSPAGTLSAGMAFIGSRTDDHDGREAQVRWTQTKEIPAELVVLDDFLPAIDDLPFVKIDVEGAEPFALRGAKKLIDRHLPTVLIEINPWYLQGFGQTVDDLWKPFADRGYELYRFDDRTRRLRKVSPADIVEDNYVFVHPSRAARLAPLMADGPSAGN